MMAKKQQLEYIPSRRIHPAFSFIIFVTTVSMIGAMIEKARFQLPQTQAPTLQQIMNSAVPAAHLNGLKYIPGQKRDETIQFVKDGKPWKTYKNYLYGYEVSVPESWQIGDNSSIYQAKQTPNLVVQSPVRSGLPVKTPTGAYYRIVFRIDSQDQENRTISTTDAAWYDNGKFGDQAINTLNLTEAQAKSTPEYKTAQEVIASAKFLYSLDDAQSFVQSIPEPQPVVIKPATSVPISNWKTFSDTDTKVSFKYPPSWSFKHIAGPDGFDPGKDGTYPKLAKDFQLLIVPDYWYVSSLSVYKSVMTPKAFIQNYFSSTISLAKDEDYKEFKLGNDIALSLKYSSSAGDAGTTYRYLISHNGKIYDFYMTDTMPPGVNNDGASYTVDLKSAIPDFEKMVKSTTFQD